MINLNPFTISGLLIIVTYLPLFILILIKGKTKAARIFSLHILSILIWGIGATIIGFNKNHELAKYTIKIVSIGIYLIPVFFYHTVLLITNKSERLPLFLIYLQSIIFIVAGLLGTLYLEPVFAFNSFYVTKTSTLYRFSFIIWLIIVSLAHLRLIYYYRKAYPEQKKQLFYLIGAIIGFIGGTTNFFPYLGIYVYPYGNFLIPLHSFLVSVAILKYQLLDIEIVLKKSIVYSIFIALISIVYLLTVLIMERVLQGAMGYKSTLFSILITFVLGTIIIPIKNKFQHFIDRIFFKGTQSEIAEQNELLRQEVAKTEKLRSIAILASGVAHEIKNPLTVVKIFTEFLPKKLDDKKFLRKFSSLVGSEVDRIDQMVHQLLEFAKPAPLALKPTKIHHLLDDTLSLLNSKFIQQRIEVTKNFVSGIDSTLNIDSNQLKQACLNLLLNAIEAMPQGGTLTIRTRLNENENFELTIEDAGVGIAKDDLPHIFDPFYSKKDGGTGLGLSITHGIIQEHGGKIRAESQVGEGTKFIIELPVGYLEKKIR